MTAQQQLAELLQIKRDYIDTLGPAAKTKPAFDKPCAGFIRDHGHAIAELIESVSAYMDKPNLQMAGPMGAALRKLTQDA